MISRIVAFGNVEFGVFFYQYLIVTHSACPSHNSLSHPRYEKQSYLHFLFLKQNLEPVSEFQSIHLNFQTNFLEEVLQV